jgi:hypothetical protein
MLEKMREKCGGNAGETAVENAGEMREKCERKSRRKCGRNCARNVVENAGSLIHKVTKIKNTRGRATTYFHSWQVCSKGYFDEFVWPKAEFATYGFVIKH